MIVEVFAATGMTSTQCPSLVARERRRDEILTLMAVRAYATLMHQYGIAFLHQGATVREVMRLA